MNTKTASKTTTTKTAAKTQPAKTAQLGKLQANKAKGDARNAFIEKATSGTLPALSVVRPNVNQDLTPAKKFGDFLDRWVMIQTVQYVATKSKFGDGISMLAHIVDRDGHRHEVWVPETLKTILEDEAAPVTYPSVIKLVRPGRAFLPSRDEPPQDVLNFFAKWLADNGNEVRIKDTAANEDIPF